MRDDLALAITEVIDKGTWTKEDIPTLEKVRNGLKAGGYTEQSEKVSAKMDGIGK
jgi:hypothetical protein